MKPKNANQQKSVQLPVKGHFAWSHEVFCFFMGVLTILFLADDKLFSHYLTGNSAPAV